MTPNKKSRAERLAEELAQKAFPMSWHDNERNAARWIAKTAYTAAEERALGLVEALKGVKNYFERFVNGYEDSPTYTMLCRTIKDWEDGK